MKPAAIESERYLKADHCAIQLEEVLMFDMLSQFRQKQKCEPAEVSVLDIGCGSGLITGQLQKKGYTVKGLDFSPTAVEKARKQGITADVCDLDEGLTTETDATHDVVWAGDIIEHVFDPMGLLKEIHRVLKPNGIIILSIPSDVGIVSRFNMLLGQSYQEQMYRRSGYYKHHTFFNLSLISFMLKNTGLQIQKTEKVLIAPNKKRLRVNFLPSPFYNELIISAQKGV